MLLLVSSKEPKDEHFPSYAYFWHYDIIIHFGIIIISIQITLVCIVLKEKTDIFEQHKTLFNSNITK